VTKIVSDSITYYLFDFIKYKSYLFIQTMLCLWQCDITVVTWCFRQKLRNKLWHFFQKLFHPTLFLACAEKCFWTKKFQTSYLKDKNLIPKIAYLGGM